MDSEEQPFAQDEQPVTKKPPLSMAQFQAQLTSQPQVREMLVRFGEFWKANGFKVKIGGAVIGVLMVVMIAVRIGQNIAALNRPKEALPSAIPTVPPTTALQKPSAFEGLKLQITNFATQLPDPAPPAVDAKISLNPPSR